MPSPDDNNSLCLATFTVGAPSYSAIHCTRDAQRFLVRLGSKMSDVEQWAPAFIGTFPHPPPLETEEFQQNALCRIDTSLLVRVCCISTCSVYSLGMTTSLYGVTLSQTVFYLRVFREDRVYLKCLVNSNRIYISPRGNYSRLTAAI